MQIFTRFRAYISCTSRMRLVELLTKYSCEFFCAVLHFIPQGLSAHFQSRWQVRPAWFERSSRIHHDALIISLKRIGNIMSKILLLCMALSQVLQHVVGILLTY